MDSRLPAILIGSSKEGLVVAREIELQIQEATTVTIWKDGVFGPGSGILDSLMSVLEQFDFAAMVLSPDDMNESRGQTYASPRDNVLFELGLFMARIGPKRVFIVHEENANLKLPSDLAGIGMLLYRKRDDKNLAAAVSPACTLIMRQVNALGFSEQRTHQEVQRLQGRQSATESRLRTLQIVVKGLVSEFEYEKLRGLAASAPFMVKFHNSMMQELNRLDAIRYVRPAIGYGIESIRERDGREAAFDLKQYIEITDDGYEYLRLRDELLQSPA